MSSASLDDRRLLEAFTRRDEAAIREVYRHYGGAVFGIAMKILNDRGHADEAAQQTFVRAWQAADRVDPSRDIGPWLYTIARRVAIDVYRRERRYAVVELDDREIAVLPPSIEGAWEEWQVRLAVEGLPPDERDILKHTYFLGYTHQETAERLDVPVGTVKSRSHRAHRKLAQSLSHLQEESA
ncbi:MAG: sigma-70 family RNA polymerase sigma factor [Actinomycetia bacterium]|nr:sigma-70 family RNA polymerase sigma factor [Actinomycetes bacterium]